MGPREELVITTDTSLEQVLEAVPELRGEDRSVEPLEGGLTNENCKVTVGDRAYVVRRWSDDGELLSIDRDNEHENSVKAAGVGVGAPVIAYLPDHGALVIEFLEGRTLSAEDLRGDFPLARIAEGCRRLHSAEAFRDDFDMFEIQRAYLRIVDDRGFRLPDGYRDHERRMERIEEALRASPEGNVPCNNDLLAENFIDSGERLWLIDYEYSGNNEASFELGNIWSESGLSVEQLDELVASYWGEGSAAKVARARLWGLMSKYGWTLWASIQDGVSEIEFDFWSWGMEKYERAVAEFEGPEFDDLLARAKEEG